MLAFAGGALSRTAAEPDKLSFGGTSATIVVDAKTATYKGLSPSISSLAVRGGCTTTRGRVG